MMFTSLYKKITLKLIHLLNTDLLNMWCQIFQESDIKIDEAESKVKFKDAWDKTISLPRFNLITFTEKLFHIFAKS